MDGPSLEYYRTIFQKSPQNISIIKKLIWSDFQLLQSQLSDAAAKNDRQQMRKELHKIRPIAYNLHFTKMIALLDQYEGADASSWDVSRLTEDINTCVAEIGQFLGER